MSWKMHPSRIREVWRSRRGLPLVVYFARDCERGLGFWNDNRDVEQPEFISRFQLIAEGYRRDE